MLEMLLIIAAIMAVFASYMSGALLLVLLAAVTAIYRFYVASEKMSDRQGASENSGRRSIEDSYSRIGKKPKRYSMHIVGEQYEGRQEVISRTHLGDPVRLKRDRHNPHDENAVKITVVGKGEVGWLSRKNSEWLAPIIDEGWLLSATVAKKFTDTYNGVTYESLMIQVDGVPVADNEDSRPSSMMA